MPVPGTVRAHLRVHGYVQGVSFRYYARQRAQSLGLSGWVRNCPDGTVEAIAQGAEDDVRHFVEWAHHGPSAAQVERVDVEYEEPRDESYTFRIVH